MNNRKIICYFCFLVFLINIVYFPVRAEEVEEIKYVSPRLPSDAVEYDPDHPENLSDDQLYAKSAILIEAESGEVIYEKNADEIMYPASTTKILTALIGIQYALLQDSLDEIVTLSQTAGDVPSDSSRIPLEIGETIAFRDLLYATLLRSGNEGANLIAEVTAGSMDNFVQMMNQYAMNLGCLNTHFQNPNGYYDPNHYTTAREMSTIAREAMKNELFRQIVSTTSYTIPKSNLYRANTIKNGNAEFLEETSDGEYYYPYANGIKTGFVNAAGYCYVGSAESNGVNLISVVFYTNSKGRWLDTQKLMDYGFSQFESKTPMELYNMNPIVIETSGFSLVDEDMGRLTLNLSGPTYGTSMNIVKTKEALASIAKNLEDNALIEYTKDFRAPIQAGEVMGTFTYILPQNGQSVEYNLVASRTIGEREDVPKTIEEIKNETYADENPFPEITLELIIIWLVPPCALFVIISILKRLIKKIKPRHRKKKIKNERIRSRHIIR